MAHDPSKTEKATGKRRGEARKKGQVARSPEINQTAVFLGGILALLVAGPGIFHKLEAIMTRGLAQTGDPTLATRDALGGVGHWAFVATLGALAPIVLATAVAGVLGNVVQVRPKITPSALKPSFARLNPLAGFKRLFSPHSLVETAKSILKLLVIGGITFFAVYPKLRELGA